MAAGVVLGGKVGEAAVAQLPALLLVLLPVALRALQQLQQRWQLQHPHWQR